MPSADDLIDQALVAHETGQTDRAATLYEQALAADPGHPDALNLLGVLRHQSGNHAEAIRLISAAIDADPQAADFHANLAEAYRADNHLAAAIDAYQRSAAIDDTAPTVWANLASLLQRTQRFDDAVNAWRRAIALDPDAAEYHNNLGLSFRFLARALEAIACFKRAIELKSDLRIAIENLSLLLTAIRRRDEAVAVAKAWVEQNPANPDALNFYALICNEAGKYRQAVDACRVLLTIDPENVQAHFTLGQALTHLGDTTAAARSLTTVIQLRPDLAAAHLHRGLTALHAGRIDEARAAMLDATRIKPDFAQAWFNLAIVHYRIGEYETSLTYATKASELDPVWPNASSLIGSINLNLGRYEEAQKALESTIQLQPLFAPALATLAGIYADQGDHDTAVDYINRAIAIHPAEAASHSVGLMSLLAGQNFTRDLVFEKSLAFGRIFEKPTSNHLNSRDPNRRLRIGYVSPDLRAHSVSFFLGGLFQHHDHRNFEIIAYDDAPKHDSVTETLRRHTDRWHRIVGMSHDNVTDLIREHEVDILIDLAGHTTGNRLPVFAAKPAPIQMSYLGFPGTSGLKNIDYRITDAVADPPGLTDPFHTESLLRLSRIHLAYTPYHSPPVNSLPANTAGHFMFGSFNNSTKINRSVLETWAKILAAIPNSKLTLKANGFSNHALRDHVTKTFASLGISASRLILLAKTPTLLEHLAVYNTIDLALDTFPYNGTTTTCEALHMGVPTLTLAGDAYVSRMGVALLTTVGLPEFTAASKDDYITKAIQLAYDLPRLSNLRQTMRQRLQASPLMDAKSLTQNIESAYRTAWQTYVSQKPTAPSPS